MFDHALSFFPTRMEFLKKAVCPLVQCDGFPCPPAISWQFGGSVVCASTPMKESDAYPIQLLLRMSCIPFPFELKPLSAGPRWRSVCSVATMKWHLSPQLKPRQECLGFAFASTGDGCFGHRKSWDFWVAKPHA